MRLFILNNLILTLIITLPLTLWGQGWEQTFGGGITDDYGYSVKQTTDGGYIIAGYTQSFGNGASDVYLIKTDGSGIQQWTQTFGGIEEDYGYSVQQTNDGGYIISGVTWSFGNNGFKDIYLIKTDENGIEQWYQTFGGTDYDSGYSVQQTNDGGYIITGRTSSFGNGSDVYLIKTDESGIQQWSQTFGGEGNDVGFSVQQTTDGGYIITGYTEYNEEDGEVLLMKTDENGIEQWSQVFGGGGLTRGASVQQTTDGGYIIAGSQEEGGNNYTYLIKTDNNGDSLWTKTFGGIYDESSASSAQQTTDGGYIITGISELNSNAEIHIYLIKTDDNGVSLWTKTFAPYFGNFAREIQQTVDGGYIIVGHTDVSGGGDNQVYLLKTDSEGNITSTTEISLPNPDRKLEKTVNLIGQEIKPQTNTPLIEIFDDGTVEKKVIIE